MTPVQAPPEVFISYASRDRERVVQVARELETAGITVWRDGDQILGAENYGPKIVQGIQGCKVLLLMCSDASMRSKNVKQEIQLAWEFDKPYLPLLLERVSYPEQVRYWLAGWQWIEVLDHPTQQWLPQVLQALRSAGVQSTITQPESAGAPRLEQAPVFTSSPDQAPPAVVRPTHDLAGLISLARFTDQIWPVPASQAEQRSLQPKTRGLGAPQPDVLHGHRLGSELRLALETDHRGHLLLLDQGPEGIIYCLCPSWFAPETRIEPGRLHLPQPGSRYNSFRVTGKPGREHLLAILTEESLGLDWMPQDPRVPARELSPGDIQTLLARLQSLEGNRWQALSTYFDVLP